MIVPRFVLPVLLLNGHLAYAKIRNKKQKPVKLSQ